MKIENPKIIYLHPAKTGGTSIEHALEEKYLGTKNNFHKNPKHTNLENMFGIHKKYGYLQHADLRVYRDIEIDLSQYFTMVSIRNPYHRVLSAYFYTGKNKQFTFEEYIIEKLEHDVALNKDQYKNQFCPQIYYYELEDFRVEYIVRLESVRLPFGLQMPKNHFGKTVASVQYPNKMDAYTKKTKDIVYELYQKDFEVFGY